MRKPVSHARARNAALLNQLATPGLGSLLCGRWIAGAGQLALALAGCALILAWFFREMSAYYGMMFSDAAPDQPNIKTLEAGQFCWWSHGFGHWQPVSAWYARPPTKKLRRSKILARRRH